GNSRKSAKDWVLGGVTSAAGAAAKPIRDLISNIPGADSGFGKLLKASPRSVLDAVLSAIKGSEDSQVGGGQWAKPVDAKYGTKFGVAGRMWSSGRHTGLDFPAPTGRAVRAVDSGSVSSVRSSGPYGNHILISHGGG
ncbi:hypothetical protein ADL01_23505, partial [Streptomyces sp. NRRL WC-3618]|uniref:peptidoglycan DD-metalloendopeptidase family protein n=1 Tax=Streptomyces sp. NRRL WC-3618 TaxID=1519490 RepID=UPI0006C13E7D